MEGSTSFNLSIKLIYSLQMPNKNDRSPETGHAEDIDGMNDPSAEGSLGRVCPTVTDPELR
jgi:hypothetical protein